MKNLLVSKIYDQNQERGINAIFRNSNLNDIEKEMKEAKQKTKDLTKEQMKGSERNDSTPERTRSDNTGRFDLSERPYAENRSSFVPISELGGEGANSSERSAEERKEMSLSVMEPIKEEELGSDSKSPNKTRAIVRKDGNQSHLTLGKRTLSQNTNALRLSRKLNEERRSNLQDSQIPPRLK
jgi:hypothetical protein